MSRYLVAALALALAGPAAAGNYRVQLSGQDHKLLHGYGGLHAADSRTEGSLVRVISPGSAITRRGTVRVLVMNLGAKVFDFGPASVRLELADGSVLSEVPLTEFAKGANLVEREMGRAASVDRRVKGDLSSLAQSASTGTQVPTGFVSGGNGTAASNAAAARQDRNQDADLLPGAKLLSAIDGVLQPAKVGPQEASGGYLVFELPKIVRSQKADQPLTIVVTAGRDEHRFAAMLHRD
ncbi:hypothetical protein [Sphingosinicella sp. BN140058]|uniref:hypothetical protein n=1 Tax=Sphingosinicella sp. BN140058 TaxID=1892855 RepID=UPI00101306B8|nr:hypothetical protein [Sphingosinicella sp. BN140058]QAY78790.1 hypothetical protein ETR14_21305 [Sphingosinicella sp. BN140058]